jgi:hypothetical protein
VQGQDYSLLVRIVALLPCCVCLTFRGRPVQSKYIKDLQAKMRSYWAKNCKDLEEKGFTLLQFAQLLQHVCPPCLHCFAVVTVVGDVLPQLEFS